MTTSTTRTTTFSISDARYVASKLGADLLNLNARYGKPARTAIDDYVEEVAQYLKNGYLQTVDFGFKDGDRWILRLRYRAVQGGQLSDAPPGALPSAATVSGLAFYSYLIHNSAFAALQPDEKASFKATLPITRGTAEEPSAANGSTGSAAQYARNGNGLGRDVYSAN